MKRACVIGWPIAHSRSPMIHGYWLKKYGISGAYEKIAVEPENLALFLKDLPGNGFEGCNVTIPHKQGAFAAMDRTDGIARRLGVVNTVYVRDAMLHGTSTDGEGFVAGLSAKLPDFSINGKSALMLGAGGSAKAVAAAILDAGADTLIIVNRTLDRAKALANELGAKAIDWDQARDALSDVSLLVNTTSLGMKGQPPLDLPLHRLPENAVVSDIIYTPLETPLLKAARLRGLRTSNGLSMLLHQAVRGFELWFGRRPEVTVELEALVEADVAKG
jgi:shikimate dehydrogenase